MLRAWLRDSLTVSARDCDWQAADEFTLSLANKKKKKKKPASGGDDVSSSSGATGGLTDGKVSDPNSVPWAGSDRDYNYTEVREGDPACCSDCS